jgi:Ser/Thr protein kinase RdoA (MazF antagonist)
LIMFEEILSAYGLDPASCRVERLDSGLINFTWKITTGDKAFILQKINTHVFKKPEAIAENLELLNQYNKKNHPEYLFVAPLLTMDGRSFIKTENDEYLRMFSFIKGSHTINTVINTDEAYEAAKQFGKFTRLFNGFELDQLHYPLMDFHNLSLRIKQFDEASTNANPVILSTAMDAVDAVKKNKSIAIEYERLIRNDQTPQRLIHHDTKISNVLFDEYDKGLCVIDLDTVMPGYFFSDVGDMMRTYLSPANEEEQDFSKIIIRPDFFLAIYKGYMEQMGNILTDAEKGNFIFSGKLMIYMQAVRFLTDHLNNNIYYQTKYPGHNLVRAKNQLYFLNQYIKAESQLTALMKN